MATPVRAVLTISAELYAALTRAQSVYLMAWPPTPTGPGVDAGPARLVVSAFDQRERRNTPSNYRSIHAQLIVPPSSELFAHGA